MTDDRCLNWVIQIHCRHDAGGTMHDKVPVYSNLWWNSRTQTRFLQFFPDLCTVPR